MQNYAYDQIQKGKNREEEAAKQRRKQKGKK